MSPQRLVLLALLLYIAWRLVKSLLRDKIREKASELFQEKAAEQAEQAGKTTVQDTLVEDPVCHTLIPQHQAIRLHHNGKMYYFCSDSCCRQFTGKAKPGGKE